MIETAYVTICPESETNIWAVWAPNRICLGNERQGLFLWQIQTYYIGKRPRHFKQHHMPKNKTQRATLNHTWTPGFNPWTPAPTAFSAQCLVWCSVLSVWRSVLGAQCSVLTWAVLTVKRIRSKPVPNSSGWRLWT